MKGGDRLAAGDWVTAGMKGLARSGVGALKAEPLAAALGVSRGSFYWHFADVAAFHGAVLAAWEARATVDIILRVEAEGGDAAARLGRLARLVFSADGALERQVRAWAAQDALAGAVLERVDRRRLAYLEELFAAAGLAPSLAGARARALYLAHVGQFHVGRPHRLGEAETEALVALLLQPVTQTTWPLNMD
jgi:AcrR family transcriptional regulator